MRFKDLSDWQRRRLFITVFAFLAVGVAIMTFFCATLYNERKHARDSWYGYLKDKPEQAQFVSEQSKDAVKVSTGTYVENIREINMKSSYYRVEFQVWFSWEGDPGLDMANNFRVYKGLVNKKDIIKEIHDGGKNYQLLSMDVTVSKNFDARRFPLESHQMRFYIESEYPVQNVLLVADHDNSGLNRSLTISGFKFLGHDVGETSYIYDSSHGDPEIIGTVVTSEIVTAMEISRSNFGLYFKCFIALFGTLVWTLIALFLCTYHHVDPLGMLPGALFGAVGNVMVGASLLPDALDMGLLEFVNIWGVITILGVSIAIININRIRSKYKDGDFAHLYGSILFYIMLAFAVVGQILLPCTAYIW